MLSESFPAFHPSLRCGILKCLIGLYTWVSNFWIIVCCLWRRVHHFHWWHYRNSSSLAMEVEFFIILFFFFSPPVRLQLKDRITGIRYLHQKSLFLQILIQLNCSNQYTSFPPNIEGVCMYCICLTIAVSKQNIFIKQIMCYLLPPTQCFHCIALLSLMLKRLKRHAKLIGFSCVDSFQIMSTQTDCKSYSFNHIDIIPRWHYCLNSTCCVFFFSSLPLHLFFIVILNCQPFVPGSLSSCRCVLDISTHCFCLRRPLLPCMAVCWKKDSAKLMMLAWAQLIKIL